MRSFVNATLASNAALMIRGRAIGRLRSDMKDAGFNIGQGTLQRIIAGETGVRMESLQKFADYFSVEVDTLLRGRVAEGEDFIRLVRLDVEAAPERSRKTNLVEEPGALQFRRDFLRAIGVSPVNACIVHVTGTSMEPTIRDGAESCGSNAAPWQRLCIRVGRVDACTALSAGGRCFASMYPITRSRESMRILLWRGKLR